MEENEDLIREYYNLLDNESNENDIQKFLEQNSELIPLPFLSNHHLHFASIISKFKLGNNFITDFAYLTKSSDCWEFVLVELEDSKKKIFTNDRENIYFSAEFNHAYDQITSWMAYVEENKTNILKQLEKIRVPLEQNPVKFRYVLIFGRNQEKNNSERRRKMLSQKNTDNIKVLTYDSLISAYQSLPYVQKKIILTPWREKGFKVKVVPNELHTNIFSYIYPEYLSVSSDNIDILSRQGYRIEAWLNNHLLSVNGKEPMKSFAKGSNNSLF
jgi:hypothetical protein